MSLQPRDDEGPAARDVVHQTLRREVNERISSLHKGSFGAEVELIDVMCECAGLGCSAAITMRAADYAYVRRFPTRFLVKEGHEIGDAERIVVEADGYVVVEASGRAGLQAVRDAHAR